MAGRKLGFMLLGGTMTAIGIIGLWVPGIPTVPFLLIAMWALSKSYTKLHTLLFSIRFLRPAMTEVEAYQKTRSISLQTKIIAQSCAWGSALLIVIITQNHALWALVALSALVCSLFMNYTQTRQ